MNIPILKPKELIWLLRDKYGFNDLEVNNFLQYMKIGSSPLGRSQIEIGEDVERVLKGEPVSYVIGWINFLGCKIDLSLKTLIPRPETEFWVDREIAKLRKEEISEIRILDLCCGSGCIGIAILKNIPNSKITFVDISEKALEQTGVNLKINKIKDSRYKIIASDLFENITGQFDFIFCNPPYVSSKEKNPDLKWEPNEALFAGKDGLDFIRKVIDQAPVFLKEGGSLFLEFGKDQRRSINRLLDKSNIKKYSFNKDQYGIYRYLSVTV